MSSRSRHDSDASRPRSGILTPDSDRSLSKSTGIAQDARPPSSSRRRPRDSPSLAMEELLKPSVAIKPHPPNVLVKPRVLQPLMLLPREHLPLAHLDLSAPHSDLPAGRFVESHIRILELEGRLGSNLLIARAESPTRGVYALERQEPGLYVVCKLGAWADLEKLSRLATVRCPQRVRDVSSRPETAAAAEPPLVTSQLHKENKKKRLAIEELQSMMRKRPRSRSGPTQEPEAAGPSQIPTPADDEHSIPTAQQPAPVVPMVPETQAAVGSDVAARADMLAPLLQASQTGAAMEGDLSADPPTAEDIVQNVRTQYLEALYHSMGSLAYFAKGPLSRARAAFHLDVEGNLDMRDLIEFLKSLVMTTVLLDKKYRETVPDIMAKMKTLVASSGEEDSKRKKTKKPKRMKLGKDGLYPAEEEHVKRWWNANKPETRDDETAANPNEARYHISRLRTRETQLQMIVILEILALEALRPAEDPLESQLPGMPSEVPEEQAADVAPKKRNKHNFPVLMDVHADRLCIWHSTALDEVKVIAESQGQQEAQKSDKHSDPLKDFCVDIIMPFFASRLPDLCDSINRKLGGPVIMSPLQPQPRSSTSSRSRPKPGAVAKRPLPTKPGRTLEKVLSNERLRRSVSRGPGDAIAQLRSATAAAIPGFKRESSEPLSINALPKSMQGTLKERSSNLLSRSDSSSSLGDSKAQQKKAMVEAELQAAISALRKPNRELAGKAIVEAAERRTSGGASQLRKTKKPTRNPLVDRVQVKATPMNNRFRDATSADAQPMRSLGPLLQMKADDKSSPSYSSSVILSSNPRLLDTPRVSATPAAVATDKMQTTPLRFAAASSSALGATAADEIVLGSSPLQARKTAPSTAFLAVPRPMGARQGGALAGPSPPAGAALFETPVKQRATVMERGGRPVPAGGSPIPASPVPGERAQSIYQQLGWDDDGDFDDLD